MSTTTKNKTAKGVRYTDAQKKEIVDFVASHNAANGRGGQSAAVNKFNVSPISVAAWMTSAGATKAAKPAKTAKAPKAAKAGKAAKTAGKSKPGTRYTAEQKQEVTDFVASYNAENGRGGQSKAAAKFSVSPITVMAWLKAAGVKKSSKKALKKDTRAAAPAKSAKGTKAASGGSDAKLGTLLALIKEIATAEAALAQLNGKFRSLQASL
jgi:DNA-binding transcriptional regulator YdaS (Cro superfamily)